MAEITIPYKFIPRDYQIPLFAAMDDGMKRSVIIWHRRAGKDKACLNVTIKEMLKRVGTYFYFFPTYNQGKKILWDGIDRDGMKYLDHFPPELVSNIDNSSLQVKLKNGSVFQIIGTDNIDSIVGTNPIGCVFSEYPLQKSAAWDFIRPILAENKGWAIFNGTPRGMNHGYKILQQAKENDWFYQVLTVDDTEVIDKETLESEKKQMPEDLFNQEYYCKFIEGAGQFFKRLEINTYQGDLVANMYHPYQMGVDLGKHQDFTVTTAFDLVEFKAGKPNRFNQLDWPTQKAKITADYYKYFQAKTKLDGTGIGDPIVDDLIHDGLRNVEGYVFTEESRKQLLDNLRLLIENDDIKIPDDEVLQGELRSFRYHLTERGKVRIQVDEGIHDDCVMSLALAVWDAPARPLTSRDELRNKRELEKQFDGNKNKSKYRSIRVNT